MLTYSLSVIRRQIEMKIRRRAIALATERKLFAIPTESPFMTSIAGRGKRVRREREKFVLLAHKNLIKPEDYAKNKSFIAPILAARKTGSTVAGGETLLMRLRGRWRSRIGDRNLFARELDFEYFFSLLSFRFARCFVQKTQRRGLLSCVFP